MEIEILKEIGLLHTDFLDKFFIMYTKLGDLGLIWIVLSIILLIKKDTKNYGCMLALTLIINMILGEGLLKHLFNRPRPFQVTELNIILKKLPITSSFPSGHAASSFAALGVFMFYIKKYVFPIGLLAVLVSASRLYLLVHYPSDILAGMVLGIAVSYFSVKYFSEKLRIFMVIN